MVRILLLAILVFTSNSVVAREVYGAWEAGATEEKGGYYAAPIIVDTDSMQIAFYFYESIDCGVFVTALMIKDEGEDIEIHEKDKKILLTIDNDFTWGIDSVAVSKHDNYLWVQITAPKENELIPALKKGNKLELKIGKMPVFEYSLKGAYKALTSAEIRCRVSLGADGMLE
jgi:hypothetical protein